MKSLIIYYSHYKGNTEKIARVFAKEIDSELMNIKDIDCVDTTDFNLIGFGSGVYRESMSPKLFRLVEKLNLRDKNVFVFSTNGVGMKFYNKRLTKLLESKGAINKGSFVCKGSFIAQEFTNNKLFHIIGGLSQGHPNDNDFKKAKEFIGRVVEACFNKIKITN
jgi:flavodoxin